jgi:hypothetical protein
MCHDFLKAVKKVLASIKMLWHPQKELAKSVGKFRNSLAFAEGAVKKVLTNLEMCWHSQKELSKKCQQVRKVLAFPEGTVK